MSVEENLKQSKLSNLDLLAQSIATGKDSTLKFIEIELTRFPIAGSPTVRFIKDIGLSETISALTDFNINFRGEAKNISEVVILIYGKKRKIFFDREDADNIIANCRNRHLSLNEKTIIQDYFSKLSIAINFGSGKI